MQPSRRVFREQSRSDFRNVGAIAPSSRWLAAALTHGLATAPGRLTEPHCLLEVGAGTGAVTASLVDAIGPMDSLVVVEQNAAFAACLEARVETEQKFRCAKKRIRILHAPARRLDPVPRFHTIVSSLPFNNFTPAEVAAHLDLFRRMLLPGGEIRFYEYLAIRRLRAAWATPSERARLSSVGRVLSEAMSACRSKSRIVWWNLPPAIVHLLRS